VQKQEGKIISNPIPFVIRLEKHLTESSESDYEPAAAIFAGTLVLVIVVFALLIPFVVRAKRRYKDGKPVFKPGSHPSSVDLQRQQSEPNWYGNTVFNYEEEVEKEKSEFTKDVINMSQKRKNDGAHGTSHDIKKQNKTNPQTREDNSTTPTEDAKKGILKKSWTLSSLNGADNENKKKVDEESKL